MSSVEYSIVILNSFKCAVASGIFSENIYLFLSFKKAVTLDCPPFLCSHYILLLRVGNVNEALALNTLYSSFSTS